jgi:hypothetical protein
LNRTEGRGCDARTAQLKKDRPGRAEAIRRLVKVALEEKRKTEPI